MDALAEDRAAAGPSVIPPPPPAQADRVDQPDSNGFLSASLETETGRPDGQKMELDGDQKRVVSAPAKKEESPAVNGKRSASPPLPPGKEEGSTSASGASTPALKGSQSPLQSRSGKKTNGAKKAAVRAEIQYIDGLRECTDEAKGTFEVLEENWYQNKSIGRTHQQEDSMVCECSWAPGDPISMACSEDSGCINYLTQVECLESECRCHKACQNQRFNRKQYAQIEIVQTDKKGYGVRLRESVPNDTFVYEYVGEIVGEKAFQKRMRDYADEGLRHFYFMQLQREEFIDATKKGGLGRFLNHSCNPNCYIAKWVVGRQLRMGIFTKRKVNQGEELTFNYNVDRYGHEAQECFCGEPNCVGFLGGKTQTDVGAMDDLYLDALGIADDVEAMSLKGTKGKKGKKMDIDYMPVMKPIQIKDVPKVASAVRQSCSSRRILTKLLRRIQITEDEAVQRQLMRLHGFSLMSMVLNEYLGDEDVIKAVFEILLRWPLITKNKLISTNIEETVNKLAAESSEQVKTLADALTQMWIGLEVMYRIPKAQLTGEVRMLDDMLESAPKRIRLDAEADRSQYEARAFVMPEKAKPLDLENLKPEDIATNHAQYRPPTLAEHARQVHLAEISRLEAHARARAAASDVNDIVARARAEAEAAEAVAAARRAEEEAEAERLKAEKEAKRERAKKRAEEKKRAAKSSASKEKKMMRLFSGVVVKTMSRYKGSLDHDQFKKRAKEVTDLLCQKERKSSSFAKDGYDKLLPEKEAKIKSFVKEWTVKLLHRKGISTASSSTPRRPSSDSVASTSRPPETPQTPTLERSVTPAHSPEVSRSKGGAEDDLLKEMNGDEADADDDAVLDADIDAELSDDEGGAPARDPTKALPTPPTFEGPPLRGVVGDGDLNTAT